MKTLVPTLTPEACREALRRFWDEQTEVVSTSNGLAVALPLMYPDGWQVQVFLETVSATQAVITDRGQTLQRLHEQGLNYDAGVAASLLDDRLRTFEVERNGFELRRPVRIPIQGIDIQLFAESLVSMAHLIYRYEPSAPVESAADQVLAQVFREHRLQPRRNVEVDGRIERRIKLDYVLDRRQRVACQVVRRRSLLLPYMEQWGFRWNDIREKHPDMQRAMIYDPDKQEWEDTALDIGRQVCDLFCPYYETQAINDFLDQVA